MTNPQIENYLTSLEKSLRALPVSDRADIVTEIKSHILSAMERDPSQPVGDVLKALGEPETVANRYLLERGQTFVKPSVSPMVKWIVIGFLGTVAMVLVFAGLVLFKFSPLVQVRGEKVKLLGGLIDVDDVSISGKSFSGHHALGPDKNPLKILATNSKIELHNSADDFRWTCKSDSGKPDPVLNTLDNSYTLDLSEFKGTKCEFFIPEKHPVNVQFTNGKIDVEKPHYDLDLKGDNGKIDFVTDSDVPYKFDVQVKVGKSGDFDSSDKANAYKIKIQLDTGLISNRTN